MRAGGHAAGHALLLRAARTAWRADFDGGKLLLIKDSYGNTFAQFPVEDYAEVHMLDLRFFRGDVAQYAKDNGITEALALYGAQGFCSNAITAQS